MTQIRNPKQLPALGVCLEFGYLNLEFTCHLVLGICDFSLPGLSQYEPSRRKPVLRVEYKRQQLLPVMGRITEESIQRP
jgi:hypothetical protein